MKKFSLPQLCEELGIDQKAARAALRKANVARPGTRWTWEMKERSTIKAIIKPAATKAKAPVAVVVAKGAKKATTGRRALH